MRVRHVLFVDSRVADPAALVGGAADNTATFLIDATQDGIAQMQRVLADYTDLDSIQVVSHGASGALYLGNTTIDSGSLDAHADALHAIGASLSESGDLLLFGCDVAAGDSGGAFIGRLARATGADVAASTDATGAATVGANWVLEAATGSIEAHSAISAQSQRDWTGTLAWYDTLSNASLRTLVAQDLGDGAFSFQEVLSLLSSAATDGVSNSEFADLGAFYRNSTSLFSSDYLRYITNAVINGNPANQFWWGGATTPADSLMVGNLAAGSTEFVAERLVDEWFKGLDLPMPAVTDGNGLRLTYQYATASGPLFENGPSASDLRQGSLGSCYLLAAFGSIADDQSRYISNAFINNGNGTYGVRFYYNGQAVYTTVNCSVPVTLGGTFAFAGNGTDSLGGELWAALLEKAYVQANAQVAITTGPDRTNGYDVISDGLAYPIREITNLPYNYYSAYYANLGDPLASQTFVSASASAYKDTIVRAVTGGSIVWLGTFGDTFDNATGKQKFVASHAFMVLGYNAATDTFTMRNPWGGTSDSYLTEFQARIDEFWNARVKGVVAVASPPVDTAAPALLSMTPADNAAAVVPTANFVLRFNESVQAGTGNIVLYNGNGTVAATIAASDSSQVIYSGATVTINPVTNLAASSNYYVNIAHGAIRDVSGNAFAGISGATAYNFTTVRADPTAPTLTSASPGDNAVYVDVASNIVLTFSEAVAAGSGNIVIYNGSGSVARTIAITDGSQVTLSGNTVTIDLAADLAIDSRYYVNIRAGVIVDLAGNAFAGISGSTALNFTTAASRTDDFANFAADVRAPVGTVFVDVPVAGNIAVEGDQDLFRVTLVAGTAYTIEVLGDSSGAGTLVDPHLKLLNSAGVEILHDEDSGLRWDSRATYTPTISGTYYIVAEESAGILTGTYKVLVSVPVDTTGPTLARLLPADDAVNVVPGSNIVLVFDEAVVAGTGNIVVHNGDGSIARTVAARDSEWVTVSGNTVTVDPGTDLDASGTYYVTVGAGAIRDLAGNPFGGITAPTAYKFTIAAGSSDDFADRVNDQSAPPGSIAIDGSASGAIEAANDHDLFRVDLAASTAYTVDLMGAALGAGSLSDPYLRVLDGTGAAVATDDDSGAGFDARLTFTAAADGSYYVEASHQGNGTGTYQVRITAQADTTAPTLTGTSPVDDARNVEVSSTLTFTFSEAVAAGAGNIVVRNVDGTDERSFDVTDTGHVTISRNIVTVVPDGDFAAGASYYVTIDTGALRDAAGNAFAGIAGTTAFNFTTATPVIDDYADSVDDSAGTPGTLDVGGSATGNIETAGDHDLFQVTLAADTTYAIDLRGSASAGGTLSDPHLRLLDASGAPLAIDDDTGTGSDARLIYRPAAGGTYYLEAAHYAADSQGLFSITGTYTVEVSPFADSVAPTLVALSPDANANGVEPGSDFVLTFSETVLAGAGNVSIFIADGTLATSIPVSDAVQVHFVDNTLVVHPTDSLASATSYYLTVDAGALIDVAGNAYAGLVDTASYSFTTRSADDYADNVADVSARTGTLAIGNIVRGTIESVRDHDLFQVTLTAGAAYIFELNGIDSSAGTLSDPYLRLLSGGGVVLARDDDSGPGFDARLSFTPTTSGIYYLDAAHIGDGTGTYVVRAITQPDVTGPVVTGTSPLDDADSVAMDANLSFAFDEAITFGRGNVVIYYASTHTIAQTIAVTPEDWTSINGNVATVDLPLDLLPNVEYYVNVDRGAFQDFAGNPFGGITGATDYSFSVSMNGDDYADQSTSTRAGMGVLTPGRAITGTLEDSQDHDLFRVSLVGGATYTVDLRGADSGRGTLPDPYLAVSNKDGTSVLSDDDSGVGVDARLTFRATASGTYYLNAGSFAEDGTAGTYEIRISGPTDTTAPRLTALTPSDNAAGIAVDRDIVLTFSEDVTASTGNIVIVDGDGVVARTIAATDYTQVTVVDNTVTVNLARDLDANSSYYVNIGAGAFRDLAGNAFAGITGTTAYNFTTVTRDDYADRLTDIRSPLGDVAEGSSVTGIAGIVGDHDLFQLTVTGGTGYFLELKGADSKSGTLANPYLRLLDSAGNEIAADDDSGDGLDAWLAFTPALDATYYVDATQIGDRVGKYRLSLGLQHVVGGAGDDALTGGIGDHVLDGFDGNDTLDGGGGNDLMRGGAGDDTYHVRDAGDVVTEVADAGNDFVFSYLASYILGDDVERGRVMIAGAANLAGNGLDNVLYAGAGNNVLDGSGGIDTADYRHATAAVAVSLAVLAPQATGGSGKDTLVDIENLTGSNFVDKLTGNAGANVLDGGAGADTMAGGNGNDTYCVDNANDVILEAANGGYDLVLSTAPTFTLAGNVEAGRVFATGTAALTGNALANMLFAGTGNNVLNGAGGIDTVDYSNAASGVTVNLALTSAQETGGSGRDTLLNIENVTGSRQGDVLAGNGAANVFDGGAGADTMSGGDGNDTYFVDDAGDLVIEGNSAPGAGGIDVVCSWLAAYVLGDNVEQGRVQAAGIADLVGNALDNVLVAGAGDNVLDGKGGADTVDYRYAGGGVAVSLLVHGPQDTGGSGYDTLIDIENLTGSVFNDTLTGDERANVLDGGAAVDTMIGGGGDDTYAVENAGDVVLEGEADGDDLVQSFAASHTLGDNVERGRVMATGTASLTGNALDNVLYAGAGNNVLNGGGGIDTVDYRYATAAVTVGLGTTAAQVTGGSGTDTLLAVENLVGSAFNDRLTGNGLVNVLDGGAGVDTMAGGAGDDTYYVDTAGDVIVEANASVAVGGFDLVLSNAGTYTLAANVETGRVLATGVANLTGNGLDNVLYAGTGNNVLNGGGGLDTVDYRYADAAVTVSLALLVAQETGGSGRDTLANVENLTGSRFDDTLTGNAAANVLDGGAGADSLTGGGGADTYFVDDVNDVVVETNATAAGGIDLVNSLLAAYTLTDNVENGRLLATGAADLTGNALANVLIAGAGDNVLDGAGGGDTVDYRYATSGVLVDLGLAIAQDTVGSGHDTLLHIENLNGSAFNDTLLGDAGANALNGGAGADVLAGGLGRDLLTGGQGNDTYRFDTALGADNIDTVVDFAGAGPAIGDMLHLDGDIFHGLLAGALASAKFESGTDNVANAAATRIVYNTQTGALFFDEDGNGAAFTAQQFAVLANHAAITAADLMVV